MKNLKKIIATVISLAIFSTNLLAAPLISSADAPPSIAPYTYGVTMVNANERLYYAENYTVRYTINNSWSGHQSVSVVLTNVGNSILENWALLYDFGVENPAEQVVGAWNAKVEQTEYFAYLTHDTTNAGDLRPGESVYAGYTLLSDVKNFPQSVDMLQNRVTKSDGFSYYLTQIQDNYHDFTAKLVITNTSSKNIFKPEIGFNSNFELLSDWAFDILSVEYFDEVNSDGEVVNTSYKNQIKPKYDKVIFAPNESILVTIKGKKSLDYANSSGDWTLEMPTISDVSLTEVVVSAEEYITRDSDGDGLPDYYELYIGTNKNEPNTDGDDLNDYEEINFGTNPLVYDTDLDFDGDFLTNFEEFLLGTDPQNPDSDGDYLADGEEVNIYGTDPLNPDSDIDGLPDGDEVKLGLNPLDPETFGYPDIEYTSEQTISSESKIFNAINTDENPYKLSLTIIGSGYAENSLEAEKSSYSTVIQNDSMVGIPVELEYAYDIETAKINFQINSDFTENQPKLFNNEELNGVKRFNIFKYFEDINMLLPIETQFDVENGVAYAEVDELGTYCVMDLASWLQALGLEEEIVEPTSYALNYQENVINNQSFNYVIDNLNNVEPIVITKTKARNIDVVFSVNCASSNMDLNTIKNEIFLTATRIFENSENAQITVIGFTNIYNSDYAFRPLLSNGSNWAKNAAEFYQLLNQIKIDPTQNYVNIESGMEDISFPHINLSKTIIMRPDSTKYLFLYTPRDDNFYRMSGPIAGISMAPFVEQINRLYAKDVYLGFLFNSANGYDPLFYQAIYYLGGLIDDYVGGVNAILDFIMVSAETFVDVQTYYPEPEIVQPIVNPTEPETTQPVVTPTEPEVTQPVTNPSDKDDNSSMTSSKPTINEKEEFVVITPNNWKPIKLNARPNKYSNLDYDGDKLKDCEEVDSNIVSFSDNGDVDLSNTLQVVIYYLQKYMSDNSDPIARVFMDGYYNSNNTAELLAKREILPIISDPTDPDTDGDGIDDKDDKSRLNNSFRGIIYGYAKEGYGKVNFNVNYKNFFENKSQYNTQTAVLSSLYAEEIYKDKFLEITTDEIRKYDNTNKGTGSIDNLMRLFGMKNIEHYNLKDEFSDDDITEFAIGHRLVKNQSEEKEVIQIVIRGTNGTIEEWSSNFDVGADTDDYYDIVGNSKYKTLWTNKSNHKGFDVSANRVLDKVKAYLKKPYFDSNTEKAIWITGHSRGAAIANILSAKLIENSYTVFGYTFASPNTTTNNNHNAEKYNSIFNVVNSDDLIPNLPPTEWGFEKYGVVNQKSIVDNYENKWGKAEKNTWEYLIGKDYNANKVSGGLAISAFNKLIDSDIEKSQKRNEIYKYGA